MPVLDVVLAAATPALCVLGAAVWLRQAVPPAGAQRVLWQTMVRERIRAGWRGLTRPAAPVPESTPVFKTTLGPAAWVTASMSLSDTAPTLPGQSRASRRSRDKALHRQNERDANHPTHVQGVWVGNVYRLQRRSSQLYPG